jgi:hypothetical protein
VTAVLLDQVADEPAQAGVATIRPGEMNELVESAVGQGASNRVRDRSTASSQRA